MPGAEVGLLSFGSTDPALVETRSRPKEAGLATDYCVKANVMDAIAAGFQVTVASDGIRAVDVNPGDGAKAIEEMRHCGARFVPAADALRKI